MKDYKTEFKGKRVLITGGSRGIGAAAAQRLIDGGATVAVTARSRHEQTPAGATFLEGDLSTLEDATAVAEKALEILGGLDILINCAAFVEPKLPGIQAISDKDWQDSLNLNFLGTVRVTNPLIDALKASGTGSIINVSSGGNTPFGGYFAHYGAAKAALNNYTQTLAKELAPAGVRVNIVTPGAIVTPGGDKVREPLLAAMGITADQFFSAAPLEGRAVQPKN